MKKVEGILFGITLAMILAGTGFLLHMKSSQKLGTPGVKVGNVPLYNAEGKQIAQESVLLPDKLPGYISTNIPISAIELSMLPKDTVFGKKIYQDWDGFQSMVTTVLMGKDRTSIHKPQYCLVGQGWTIDKTEQVNVKMTQPFAYDLPVMKLTATLRGKDKAGKQVLYRGLYVYWFVADQQITAKHTDRMWWMAKNLLTKGVLDRWAYISCFSQCVPGEEDVVFKKMEKLIGRSTPEFQLATGKSTVVQAAAGSIGTIK